MLLLLREKEPLLLLREKEPLLLLLLLFLQQQRLLR